MELRKLLRKAGVLKETAESVAAELKLHISRHAKYPNLIQFKYDMIEADFNNPAVREARGCILDENNHWEIIARPFDKFFNIGEGLAAPIDWTTAKVQEKLDGSLIIMYFYDGKWQVATSGTCDASGNVNGLNFDFAELFWETFRNSNLVVPPASDDLLTFMFELMTPYNRVVVNHKKSFLRLIGVRSKYGKEYPVEDFSWLCPTVQSFPLQSFEQIAESFKTMNPLTQEGYVVVDDNFNRVKVKHPGYIALHRAKDGFGPKAFVETVRMGETDEFLLALKEFPEWEQPYLEIKGRYDKLVDEIESKYATIKHIENQKEFALQATQYPYSGALFMIRKGKVKSAKEFLSKVSVDHVVDALHARDVVVLRNPE
jgi:hypothetical protein